VDPALVRYYFSNRAELLLAVASTSRQLGGVAPDRMHRCERLSGHVADMLEFSRRMRPMQRLMIDELAKQNPPRYGPRSRAQRRRGQVLPQFLRAGSDRLTPPPIPVHACRGHRLCEFFAAAQAMILPLAPKHLDASELARRYEPSSGNWYWTA
jgi:hypothetical protein